MQISDGVNLGEYEGAHGWVSELFPRSLRDCQRTETRQGTYNLSYIVLEKGRAYIVKSDGDALGRGQVLLGCPLSFLHQHYDATSSR